MQFKKSESGLIEPTEDTHYRMILERRKNRKLEGKIGQMEDIIKEIQSRLGL